MDAQYVSPAQEAFPAGLTSNGPHPGTVFTGSDWFRFGDGYLELRCDHAAFRARFVDLFLECRVDGPAPAAGVVRCSIAAQRNDQLVRVDYDDPEPLDQLPVALASLAAFAYAESPSSDPNQRVIRSPRVTGSLCFDARGFVADAESPWPTVAGPLATHRVMRLQRGTLFFHAAAVGIRERGLLLMGPKEAGKTTLSLALAERGHQFFSDEMSAVRQDSLEILPFRRRLSIRPGPAAPGVQRTLEGRPFPVVDLGDGTRRTRAQPTDVVPTTLLNPVPARAIFFLGAKGGRPRADRFTPAAADLRLLTPYESATWGRPPAQLVLGLLRLLGRVRGYHLDLGPVSETARLLEDIMTED